MRPIYTLILTVPILLTAQPKSASQSKIADSSQPLLTQDPIATMQKQIAELLKQVESLNKVAEEYKSRFPWYEDIASERKDLARLSELFPQAAMLDPNKRGFGAITSNQGAIFFVSLEQVEPFLDGYKIVLKIGNPYTAVFSGLKVVLEWNKRMPDSIPDFQKWQAEWKKTMRSEEFSDTTELSAGTWTRFPIVLAQTKADELGWILVSQLTVSVVAMSK
jgi:hypothetical protein